MLLPFLKYFLYEGFVKNILFIFEISLCKKIDD